MKPSKRQLEEILKLPALSKFKGTNKQVSPYEKLYKWVVEELMPLGKLLYKSDSKKLFHLPDDKTLDIGEIALCKEDYDKFRVLVVDWMRKYYCMSKKQAQKQEHMFSFNTAPVIILEKDRPQWIKPGYVYVSKKFIANRSDFE